MFHYSANEMSRIMCRTWALYDFNELTAVTIHEFVYQNFQKPLGR